jgi:hypothetical protein
MSERFNHGFTQMNTDVKTKLMALFLGGALALAAEAAAAKVLYQNDFEKAAVDAVPDEFLISEGAFAVKADGGNKFLELPGAPLDTFGFYFGPTERENLAVTARFNGTGKGRLRPTYALSLGAGGQFKLQMSPAKKAIELYKGEEVAATAPFDWPSGKWLVLHLQVRKAGSAWKVEGKVWPHGEAEPKDWTITLDVAEEPLPGRPAIWASPFAGTPIQFDDLKVTALTP